MDNVIVRRAIMLHEKTPPFFSGFRPMLLSQLWRYYGSKELKYIPCTARHNSCTHHTHRSKERMTAYGTSSSLETLRPPPLWVCTLLGLVMIAAGILVLSDVMLATLISVKLIGFTVIAAGAFEIVHAFWTKGWGGFLWQILLGALYLAFGLVLLNEPAAGALILTYLLGALLFASGIIRCILSFAYWPQSGWMMLISGAFGVVAGLLILFGFPAISRWALGFLLGVDLLSHGFAWLLYALQSVRGAV
jgi:uncharacterized membrane protein HdeD (DUF308 family)